MQKSTALQEVNLCCSGVLGCIDGFGILMALCRVHRRIWNADGAMQSAGTDLECKLALCRVHSQIWNADGAMQVCMNGTVLKMGLCSRN